MATPVQLPALSPTMKEGKITKWLKKEGDPVSSGEAIAECETDKSNLEIEVYDDGVLLKILVQEGESAPVGAPIAFIGAKGETVEVPAAAPAPAPGPAVPAAATAPATPPASAATPAPAAAPAAKAPVPPPAPAAAPSPVAGKKPAPARPEMARRAEEPQPEHRVAPQSPTQGQVVPIRREEPANDGRLRASPLAKRMAQDEGVDLSGVQGSGPQGRIVKRDVEAALAQPPAATPAARSRPAPTPRVVGRQEPDVLPVSSMRKLIAQRMAEVKPGVPHFYLTIDVDMEEAVRLREEAKAAEVKVSVNDLIVKAAAIALLRQPKINVSIQGDRILQFHNADVGIAVAIEDGLITPVVRDADQKSLGALAAESRDLADRARRRALRPEEYTGGGITVSNLGMFGIDNFIAVINPPQASILAVGSVSERVVVRDGAPAVRKMMTVTFSGDHRIVDGALGAQYLQELKALLEHPMRLAF